MFQLKNTESGIKESISSTALPNSYGKIQTFKEDLENFRKRGKFENLSEEEFISPQNIRENPPSEFLKKNGNLQNTLTASTTGNTPPNPFIPTPTPPPISLSNSSLSQDFFADKSLSQEINLPQRREDYSSSLKPRSRAILSLIVILFTLAAGIGLLYYWFYAKNNSPTATPTNQTTATTNPLQNTSSENQNKNLRRLVVDISQSPTEIKNAIHKFATDFNSSSSDNSLVEIKLLNKNNQLISKKDFFSSLGATIPNSILTKISEDFSIFVTKVNGDTRLGLAFKTITSSGLADEMKKWEPKIAIDLNSLYLVSPKTNSSISFASSRYKNADIRYFNFSTPANTSLDYSIISNFLVISTSKDSLRSILNYMSEK